MMTITQKIKRMRDRARKLRLKYRKKGDTRMADDFRGQEIALNQVLPIVKSIEIDRKFLEQHEARIKKLESVLERIDTWLEAYRRDKTPPPNYPPEIWRAVKNQAIVILKDLKRAARRRARESTPAPSLRNQLPAIAENGRAGRAPSPLHDAVGQSTLRKRCPPDPRQV